MAWGSIALLNSRQMTASNTCEASWNVPIQPAVRLHHAISWHEDMTSSSVLRMFTGLTASSTARSVCGYG